MNGNSLLVQLSGDNLSAAWEEIQLVLNQLGKDSKVNGGKAIPEMGTINLGQATESEVYQAMRYALDTRFTVVKHSWTSDEVTERLKTGLAALQVGAHIIEYWDNLPAFKIKLGGASEEEIRTVVDAAVNPTEA